MSRNSWGTLIAWCTRWEKVFVVFGTVIGTVFVSGGLFALYGVWESDRWERHKFTTSVIKEWNGSTESYKKTIFAQYPSLSLPGFTKDNALSKQDATNLLTSYTKLRECNASSSASGKQTERCKELQNVVAARDALVGLLNHFDYLAVSYQGEWSIPRPSRTNSKICSSAMWPAPPSSSTKLTSRP